MTILLYLMNIDRINVITLQRMNILDNAAVLWPISATQQKWNNNIGV